MLMLTTLLVQPIVYRFNVFYITRTTVITLVENRRHRSHFITEYIHSFTSYTSSDTVNRKSDDKTCLERSRYATHQQDTNFLGNVLPFSICTLRSVVPWRLLATPQQLD